MSDPKEAADIARMMKQKERVHLLTEMQQRFVVEYLIDFDQTNAAIRAGYDPHTAGRIASKMMKKGSPVQLAVARANAERNARAGLNADSIRHQIGWGLRFDVRKYFRVGGLVPIENWEYDDARQIEGIKVKRMVEMQVDDDGKQKLVPVEIMEFKFTSKTTLLAQGARILGMNNDKLEITTPLAQRIDEAYQRTGLEATKEESDTPAPERVVLDAEYEMIAEADETAVATDHQDMLRKVLGLPGPRPDEDDGPDLAAILA